MWAYVGYPILLVVFVLLSNRRRRVLFESQFSSVPSVSLLISAYNEEKVIEEKLRNSLILNYPKEKFEIMVVSDASDDRTDEILRGFERQGVRLLRVEGRKGKVFCKNEAMKVTKGEVVVFSDANTMYEPDAIKELVKHFSDPEVGCVSGELRYRHEGGVRGESLYWKYEQWIKRMEGRLGSLTTVNGAIYAVRKDVLQPLPIDVPDDFATTLLIRSKGLKVLHEPQAVAWEETAPHVLGELRRRVRMVVQARATVFSESPSSGCY